jgi:beta-mannanase
VPGYGAALVLAALLGGLGGAALPRAAYAVLWQSPDHLRSAVGALSTPGTGDRCPTLGATALELATRGGAGRAGGGGEAAAAPVAGDACPSVFLPPERPFLGVYDPGGAMTGPADVEEVFVQWKPTAGQEVRAHLQRVAAQRRVALVVVEPYPWNVGGLGEQTLLADIAGGGYDSAIAGIAEAVRELQPSPVLLRFGHEMDLTGLYPWSRNDPAASVAAYRHFVNRVRETAPNARFIWSPSGAAGSDRFYPGDDVVDAVGISLLVAEDWSGSDAYPSFAQLVRDHGVLATRHGKPLVVAETGAAIHDPAAQLRWVREARAAIDQFPGLLGVVYFDDRCPPLPWPGAARPDWRLTPAGLSVFFATPSSDLP